MVIFHRQSRGKAVPCGELAPLASIRGSWLLANALRFQQQTNFQMILGDGD